VTDGGTAAYGIKKSSSKKPDSKKEENADKSSTETTTTETQSKNNSKEVISGFYAGKNTIADLASVLQTEMPVIPVLYRTGVLFCNDNIENVKNSSSSDIYFSIESYIYS
jgi:hypothetical protein